jgi:hypothetical protein
MKTAAATDDHQHRGRNHKQERDRVDDGLEAVDEQAVVCCPQIRLGIRWRPAANSLVWRKRWQWHV